MSYVADVVEIWSHTPLWWVPSHRISLTRNSNRRWWTEHTHSIPFHLIYLFIIIFTPCFSNFPLPFPPSLAGVWRTLWSSSFYGSQSVPQGWRPMPPITATAKVTPSLFTPIRSAHFTIPGNSGSIVQSTQISLLNPCSWSFVVPLSVHSRAFVGFPIACMYVCVCFVLLNWDHF